MSKQVKSEQPEMLEEYDFSKGVRGKYASAFREGTNLVAIDPDLLAIFPDSEAVNRALRSAARSLDNRRASHPRSKMRK
jgi:hypothetical protein